MTEMTVCAPDQNITEQTEATAFVSNNDFLKAIFRDLPEDVSPVYVGFYGTPNGKPGSSWRGRRWVADNSQFVDDQNNYFSVSAFRPDEKGRYRRRKDQFAGCYCIMLDDVGTKVDIDAIVLEPSWLVETSAGNFQAGFILEVAIQDVSLADQLQAAVIEAGLCDPGASGPSARLARLPVAVNGKHAPAFNCRLEAWRPHLKYTVDQLVSGLNLTLKSTTKISSVSKVTRQGSGSKVLQGNDVWTPRPSRNVVLERLVNQGLHKRVLGDGKHEITCPWLNEHTNAVDSGTAYWEPDSEYPKGGFRCLHGHCSHRSISDLLEIIGVDEISARMKSVIRVTSGEFDRVVDMAERVLAECGRHYQFGRSIVSVVGGEPGTDARIVQASVESLKFDLARSATWQGFDARSQCWVSKDPSERHVRALHKKGDYSQLPELKGIVRQPYFTDAGELISVPGYEPVTKMYGAFDPLKFVMPDSPSRDDAVAALNILLELLEEFQFVSEADRSAALCAMLTAAIRPSLPNAVMFMVVASAPGTGKTMLCRVITAFAATQQGQPITFPISDEECTKLLLAELRNSPPVIEFDNLVGDLIAHPSLCSVLTGPTMRGRILGQSETTEVGTRTLFLASGNNVGPAQDMVRRCLTIRLTCNEENPALRAFKKPYLLQDLRANRELFVSAALTILRAWIVAGMPQQAIQHLGSFESWSSTCRHPLVWLGLPDPATNIFENMANDPERDLMSRLFAHWTALFAAKPVRVREVIKYLDTAGHSGSGLMLKELLEDIVGDYRGGINTRSLGKWLASKRGRIVDGKQLVRVKSSSNGDSWAVL